MHTLEKARQVGDFDSAQAAVEQCLHRQHATALITHGDNDLVDV